MSSNTLPKDWKLVKLNDIAYIKHGKRPKIVLNNLEYKKGMLYPIYGAGGFSGYTDRYLVDNEYIIVIARVGVGSVGKVYLAKGKIWVNDNALYIQIKNKLIDPIFLYYMLVFYDLKRLARRSAGGYAVITQSSLGNIEIPLPPLDEQRKIARILYTVDEAIAKTDAIISRVEELHRALLDYLMTHGIGHKEYKETEIGKIPKEWKVVKLKDVTIKVLGGGTPSTKNPRYWDGNIPWMTSVGIPEDDIYITKGERFITEEGLKNSATNVIPKGNLIIATRVGLGKAGVNLIDIAINQDLVGLIVNKNTIVPEFLAWYIRSSRALSHILAHARGTTIKGISRQVLLDLKVPIPPLEEQKKIVDVLNSLTTLLKNEKSREEKLELIKRVLMHFLLTGKIRVKDLSID